MESNLERLFIWPHHIWVDHCPQPGIQHQIYFGPLIQDHRSLPLCHHHLYQARRELRGYKYRLDLTCSDMTPLTILILRSLYQPVENPRSTTLPTEPG